MRENVDEDPDNELFAKQASAVRKWGGYCDRIRILVPFMTKYLHEIGQARSVLYGKIGQLQRTSEMASVP